MSTFNVNIFHISNPRNVPISTPRNVPISTPQAIQPAGNSYRAGAIESGVAPQAPSLSSYHSRPWPGILSLVAPTPRDLLDIYYARYQNHNVDGGTAVPNVESTSVIRSSVHNMGFTSPNRSSADVRVIGGRQDLEGVSEDGAHSINLPSAFSGPVADESEIMDTRILHSLATGTIDPILLIRTLPHYRDKHSQGAMRSRAAGVPSDRYHPYNVMNKPSRIAVPRNGDKRHANNVCRPSGETENSQIITSQHREHHHGHGSGYDIPVEQMPLTAPNPSDDGRESRTKGERIREELPTTVERLSSTGDGDSGETEQRPRKIQGHRSDKDPFYRTREEIYSQRTAGVGRSRRRRR
ncbi:hypothetical protein JR316_0011252 [Psilocybe cubensis]|uniref:Uncharacterized protein n=1 Tax=Psilocybe cubensis TaxID=181762 RepID=A0ACB8GJI0_PSICU|nr:hypothetical protein JR316_0011252 [Psilocybe cubensis]KAH9475693.1 hypothetical protein JR316_0011252 [Psilocybe cubensis]